MARTKPFLGVPFTAKDCFAVKGLSQTVGLKARTGYKAEHDADTARLMREAGAIPIGEYGYRVLTKVSRLIFYRGNKRV